MDEHAFTVGATARDTFSIALRDQRAFLGERPTANARFGVTPSNEGLIEPAIGVLMTRTAFWWWTASGDGLHVRREHVTEPLSWIRLLSPEELDVAQRCGAAWCGLADTGAPDGREPNPQRLEVAERTRLARALDEILLAHLGASPEDADAFLAGRGSPST